MTSVDIETNDALRREFFDILKIYNHKDPKAEGLSKSEQQTLLKFEDYLKSIAKKLLNGIELDEAHSLDNIVFHLCDIPQKNAFAVKNCGCTDKKHIAVSLEMLKAIQHDEGLLAALLAHELGHILHDYMQKHQMNTTKVEEGGSDVFALEMLKKAGYNPKSMREMMQMFAQKDQGVSINSFRSLVDVHPVDNTRLAVIEKYLDLYSAEISQVEKENKYIKKPINQALLDDLKKIRPLSHKWEDMWQKTGKKSLEDFIKFLPNYMCVFYKTDDYSTYDNYDITRFIDAKDSSLISISPQKGHENDKVWLINPACVEWILSKISNYCQQQNCKPNSLYNFSEAFKSLHENIYEPFKDHMVIREGRVGFMVSDVFKKLAHNSEKYATEESNELLDSLRGFFKGAIEDPDNFDLYLKKIQQHPLLDKFYRSGFAIPLYRDPAFFQKGLPFVVSPYRKPLQIGDKLPWIDLLQKIKETTDEAKRENYLKVLETVGVFDLFSLHDQSETDLLGGKNNRTIKDAMDNAIIKLVNDPTELPLKIAFQQINDKLYAYYYNQQNQVVSVEKGDDPALFFDRCHRKYFNEVYTKWYEAKYQSFFDALKQKASTLSDTPISQELIDDLDLIMNFSTMSYLGYNYGGLYGAIYYDIKQLVPAFQNEGKPGYSGNVIDHLKDFLKPFDETFSQKASLKYLEIADYILKNYHHENETIRTQSHQLFEKLLATNGFWRVPAFLKDSANRFKFYQIIAQEPFKNHLRETRISRLLKNPYRLKGVYNRKLGDGDAIDVAKNNSLFEDVLMIAKIQMSEPQDLKRLIYSKYRPEIFKDINDIIDLADSSSTAEGLYFTEMIDALINKNIVIPIEKIDLFYRDFFEKFQHLKDDSVEQNRLNAISDYIEYIGKDKIEKGFRFHIQNVLNYSRYSWLKDQPSVIMPFVSLYKTVDEMKETIGFKEAIQDETKKIILDAVSQFKKELKTRNLEETTLFSELLNPEFKDFKKAFPDFVIEELFNKKGDDSVFLTSPEKYLSLFYSLAANGFFIHSSPLKAKIGLELIPLIEKLPLKDQEKWAYQLLDQRVGIDNTELNIKLSSLWSRSISKMVGPDDQSMAYRDKVMPYIQKLKHHKKNQEKYNDPISPVRAMMGKNLQDDLVSQYDLSMEIEAYAGDMKSLLANSDKTQLAGILIDFFVLASSDNYIRKELRPFLLQPLEKQDLDRVCSHFKNLESKIKYAGYKDFVMDKAFLINYYNIFWQAPLELRCLLLYSLHRSQEGDNQETRKEILNYLFDETSPQIMKDALYNYAIAVEDNEMYRADFLLTDCLAVSKPTTEKSSPAKILKLFLEAQGPAGIKIGQLLSARRELPADVRHELASLTNWAPTPSRAEIFRLIENYHPKLLDEVKQNGLGRILGAASHYITLDLNDNEVLSISREKSGVLAEAVYQRILKAIDLTLKQKTDHHKLLMLFKDAVEQAYSMNDIELDGTVTIQQNLKAIDIFDGIHVKSDDWSVDFHVMVPAQDQKESNLTEVKLDYESDVCYKQSQKIIQKSKGYSWNNLEEMIENPSVISTKYPAFSGFSQDELKSMRQALAQAHFFVNMKMIFQGDVFDDDRHTGQFNFDITGDKKLRTDLFDFGALSLTPPNKKELRSFGRLLMKTYLDYQKLKNQGYKNESLVTLFSKAMAREKKQASSLYLSKVVRALGQLEHYLPYVENMPSLLNKMLDYIHPEIFKGAIQELPLHQQMMAKLVYLHRSDKVLTDKFKEALFTPEAPKIEVSQQPQQKPDIITYPTKHRDPVISLNRVLDKGTEAYEEEPSPDSTQPMYIEIKEHDLVYQDYEDKKKKIIQNIESYRASQKQNDAVIILPNKSYMGLCQIVPQEIKLMDKEILKNQELKLYVSEKSYQRILKALKEKKLDFKVIKPLTGKSTKKSSSLKTSEER